MKVTSILVETDDGVVRNIVDLPKEEYEFVLDLFHSVRLMYISMKEAEERGELPSAE